MIAPTMVALAEALVRKLGGMWQGDHGMCHCPAHDDRTPSLSVRIGDKALLFTCFAGCDRKDVLRAIRRIDPNTHVMTRASGSPYRVPARQPKDLWLQQRATDLWERAVPLPGTLAAAYLARKNLHAYPPALRYCPATQLGTGRGATYRPSMIAAVHEGSTLLAVQRTFFEREQPRRARDLGDPRRMLARPMGGAVMLEQPQDILGLAEGIETAMSAAVLLDIPVWATLGSERLGRITLPPQVSLLLLLPDRDQAGKLGLAKALRAYRASGCRIKVLWPPMGFKDWNDVLRMGGKGGGMGGAWGSEWSARLRQEIVNHG